MWENNKSDGILMLKLRLFSLKNQVKQLFYDALFIHPGKIKERKK